MYLTAHSTPYILVFALHLVISYSAKYNFFFSFYANWCLSTAATLTDPVGFSVVIVDPSADLDPVTANLSWTALDRDTTYTVTVSYENGSEVTSLSIPHPNSFLEIPGLPACINLTATLAAERGSKSSNGTVKQFSTSDPTRKSVSCIHTCMIVQRKPYTI